MFRKNASTSAQLGLKTNNQEIKTDMLANLGPIIETLRFLLEMEIDSSLSFKSWASLTIERAVVRSKTWPHSSKMTTVSLSRQNI